MSQGFKLISGIGSTVVDSSHVTLSVVEEGQLQYSGGLNYNSSQGYYREMERVFGVLARGTFSSPIRSQLAPLVALFPSSPVGGVHSYLPTGGPGNWTGFTLGYHYEYDRNLLGSLPSTFPSIPPIPWRFAAARPDIVVQSQDSHGVRVWDGSGRLVFDSGTKIITLLSRISSWNLGVNYAAYAEYSQQWPYPFDGRTGILVSNLSGAQVLAQSLAGAWVSARFGFSISGQLRAVVTGVDDLSASRMAGYGGDTSSRVKDEIINVSGGPQVFAVRV